MDLGCIDMGCVEKLRNEPPPDKDNSPKESLMSASKLGKNNKAKDALRSSINALNKLTSQISKPPRRKTSPINWFPRKKVEPYLKRKIKMLQEVDGMKSTLDETLGDSNPHYCRVLREKIAIKEAAEKAMEARKAAMVEASWCRILQAARIECKEAEAELSKAEACAAEAFEAAREAGVTMNDIPDCSQNHFKIETTSAKEGSTTHTVSATFETAFEVDKQVASAVKAAFIKLANCPSINKDEFKELLRRISENPDTDDNLSNDLSSECESDTGIEQKRQKERHEEEENYNLSNIVDTMLGRLQCLKEEELSSLATIVATRGLNAALAETENRKQHKIESTEHNPTVKVARRTSVARGRVTADAELPSLDKFLVKKLTRLEREVLEAKNARNNEAAKDNESEQKLLETEVELKEEGDQKVQELGSVLMKRSSKLEKEIEEARRSGKRSSFEMENNEVQGGCKKKQEVEEIPSLDKYLVKRLTRLERDVQEAKNRNKLGHSNGDLSKGKENTDVNKVVENGNDGENYESLDKVLVKRVSRLEKEKLEFCADEQMRVKHKRKEKSRELENGEGSLDQVMVKHTSRLEREKMAATAEKHGDWTRHLVSRRQAREKELQAAWGGLSLGNSIRPHVSRLQKDKDAWLKADEEERKREMEEVL